MESVLTKAGVLGAPIPAYPFCRSGHHFSLRFPWYGSAVYARNSVSICVVATVFFWIRASVLHCRYALLLDPFTSSTQAVEAKASSATGILPCLCRACSLFGVGSLDRLCCGHPVPTGCSLAGMVPPVPVRAGSCLGLLHTSDATGNFFAGTVPPCSSRGGSLVSDLLSDVSMSLRLWALL